MSATTKVINKYLEVVHACDNDISQLGLNVAIPFFSQSTIIEICTSYQKFTTDMSVVDLIDNYTIVGDLHGNLHNLLEIFRKFGFPPKKKYLFTGNITEFGEYSLEVVTLLLAYQVHYPSCVVLLRGTTESVSLGIYRGLWTDTNAMYKNPLVYEQIMKCFSTMPFVAILAGNIFCGQPDTLKKYNNVSEIRRVSSHIDLETEDKAYNQILKYYESYDIEQGNRFIAASKLDFLVLGNCNDSTCCESIGAAVFISSSAEELSCVLPIICGGDNKVETFESVDIIDRVKAKFCVVKDSIVTTTSKKILIIPKIISRPLLNKISVPYKADISYTKSFKSIPYENCSI